MNFHCIHDYVKELHHKIYVSNLGYVSPGVFSGLYIGNWGICNFHSW